MGQEGVRESICAKFLGTMGGEMKWGFKVWKGGV